MGSNYKIYQDSVTSTVSDTSNIISRGALNTVDTIDSIDKEDSQVSTETIIPLIPKTKTVKERTIKAEQENIQEKNPVGYQIPEKEIKTEDSSIPKNFLKNIDVKNVTGKPGEVFLEQNKQYQFKNNRIGSAHSLITNDWVLPILFVSMGIMIWVRNAFMRHMGLLFGSINNYQLSLKLFKDPSTRFRNLTYILNLNSALMVGLFIFQLAGFYNVRFVDGSPFMNYLAILLFLFIIYALQFIAYSIIGNVLQRQTEYYEFMHHTYTLIKVLGIIVMPITVVNAYATDIVLPFFLILGSIIIVFFYLKRIQRGILILMQKQFLKFHQILYFCTLEILPVMVISKLVSSLIKRSF